MELEIKSVRLYYNMKSIAAKITYMGYEYYSNYVTYSCLLIKSTNFSVNDQVLTNTTLLTNFRKSPQKLNEIVGNIYGIYSIGKIPKHFIYIKFIKSNYSKVPNFVCLLLSTSKIYKCTGTFLKYCHNISGYP